MKLQVMCMVKSHCTSEFIETSFCPSFVLLTPICRGYVAEGIWPPVLPITAAERIGWPYIWDVIAQKTVGRWSSVSGNQQVIGSHAKWPSVIDHCRSRGPTMNKHKCYNISAYVSRDRERKRKYGRKRQRWLPNFLRGKLRIRMRGRGRGRGEGTRARR